MAKDKVTQAGPSTVTEASVAARSAGIHAGVEWTAGPLRPVAHWVTMPVGDGRTRLEMVWEVPDPIAPGPWA